LTSLLLAQRSAIKPRLYAFGVAAFLVSIPVFVQAPLVRIAPFWSLALTLGWLFLSYRLRTRPNTRLLGSLLFGFTLSWWCGGLYWGWLREDPLWHLPVEALGIPIAMLAYQHFRVGSAFYLGSFVGTTLTDVYIWGTGLTPWWGRVMRDESPENLQVVMDQALGQMHTLWGLFWGLGVGALLLIIGLWAMRSRTIHHWAFAGAVLSTLVVGGMFWASAMVMASF